MLLCPAAPPVANPAGARLVTMGLAPSVGGAARHARQTADRTACLRASAVPRSLAACSRAARAGASGPVTFSKWAAKSLSVVQHTSWPAVYQPCTLNDPLFLYLSPAIPCPLGTQSGRVLRLLQRRASIRLPSTPSARQTLCSSPTSRRRRRWCRWRRSW